MRAARRLSPLYRHFQLRGAEQLLFIRGAFGNQCNLIISDCFSVAGSLLKSSADLSWALEREKPKPKLALS